MGSPPRAYLFLVCSFSEYHHVLFLERERADWMLPCIGIYLAPLQRVCRLPDLIDPTAPTELVSIEPVSGNFSAPAHPEVFDALPPLPPSMHLEPLINVHKQRLVARTVKALVAGQHLASRLQYPIDRRLFQRCLRLRGFDPATLHRKLAMCPD
jgi:GDP/GTP exchange factor required for growth at low temperature